jgi:hypothetical protein
MDGELEYYRNNVQIGDIDPDTLFKIGYVEDQPCFILVDDDEDIYLPYAKFESQFRKAEINL